MNLNHRFYLFIASLNFLLFNFWINYLQPVFI